VPPGSPQIRVDAYRSIPCLANGQEIYAGSSDRNVFIADQGS